MFDNQRKTISSIEAEVSSLEMELLSRTEVSPYVEKVILVGFTNRTNTGALATALGRSPMDPPVTRHIQPFKAIARQIMEKRGVGASTPLTYFRERIELGPGSHLVKETNGPNKENPAEWIDSMKLLLKKGVDPGQMIFIPTFRETRDCVASWRRMWGWDLENFPFDSFNNSLKITDEKISFANSVGMTVVPYVHEFLRDHDRFDVIARMCSEIGITYSPAMVQWDNPVSNRDDEVDWYFQGSLIKYDQPPDRWVQGSLGVAHGGRGGIFWQPVESSAALTDAEWDFVSARIQPAIEIHEFHARSAQIQLGL